MNFKLITYIALTVVLTGCWDDRSERNDPSFRVVVDVAAPSSFMVGGERYGYGYELMGEWAATQERELVLEDNYSFSAAVMALEAGRADAVVTLKKSTDNSDYEFATLFTTDYVILTSKRYVAQYRTLRDGLTNVVVGDAAIMLAAGFDNTLSYSPLLDSLHSAHIYSSSRDIYQLAQEVVNGNYQLLVCERSQAMLVMYMQSSLVQVYEFAERIAVNVMFNRSSRTMAGFDRWFAEFRQTQEFRALTGVYMERGLGRRLHSISRSNRVVGGISVWDEIIQSVAGREGVDWLLLSAIAYHESRFNNNVVSPRGATGIMQIMPVVARHFRFDAEQLSNPDINVTIAAKLIKSINKELKFPPEAPETDRLAIMLAAYNCGIGTVQSARRQAEADGVDPNSWETIELYIVQNGIKQTSGYVRDVMRKYSAYKTATNS